MTHRAVRHRGRRPAAGASGLLAVALTAALSAGCTSDAEDGTPRERPTASPTAPATEDGAPSPTATSPTAPTSPATPSVSAATGVALELPNVSVRAPEGWEAKKAPATFMRRALGPGAAHQLILSSTGALGEVTLEELTTDALQTHGVGRAARRAPVELGGVRFYHLVTSDAVFHREIFGTLHDGELVTLEFVLDRARPAAERRQVVAASTASLTFTG